jgi:Mn2+/Fe2+ NRAMP family transporter
MPPNRSEGVLTTLDFGSDASRRSVLDRAHRGDIVGGLGRVAVSDTPRGSHGRRLFAFLAIMGPGVVVMVAGNDAGSFATVAQAGQDYGFRLAWIFGLLAVALFVIQEMSARLGAVTGAGLGRLIKERFGPSWARFALVDLVVLGVLTVITEFIGMELGFAYLGVSRYVAIPVAAALLLGVTATGSFRQWERCMYGLVGVSLVAVPLAAAVAGRRSVGGLVLSSRMGHTGTGMLFAVGIVGATVAPWQLFFQQSSVVDKRITSRWLAYERLDTALGAALYLVVGLALLVACAVAFHASPLHGRFVDAGQAIRGLRDQVGSWAGTVLAIVLIDGSLLGASAIGLASSYAVGDVYGTRHSLHRRWGSAKAFYSTYAVTMVSAAVIALAVRASFGTITLAVQALSGALFPSAAVFLVMLANDREVLGPHVNSRWFNAVSLALVGGLVVLGFVLDVNTAFPHMSGTALAAIAGGVAVAGLAAWMGFARPYRLSSSGPSPRPSGPRDWTMPPIETLSPPVLSRSRSFGLIALRAYLIITLVCAAVRLGGLMVG